MSIYRNSGKDVPNDVYGIGGPQEAAGAEARSRLDPEQEEAARRNRSKAAPCDIPLPRTRAWAARLPEDVRPQDLLLQFPRIANLLAAAWDDPDATHAYLDDLMIDRRGNRKGFPPGVAADLKKLRSYYGKLRPQIPSTLEYYGKR